MKSRNTDRTYDWNGHKGLPISFSHLTDEQMAGTVRMLMRHDLGHEGIVCGARDRIMCLMKEKAELEARVADLIAERDNLATIVANGIDEVAGAALDDAEETIERLTKDPTRQTNSEGAAEIFEALWKNHRDELLARVAELEAELASRPPSPHTEGDNQPRYTTKRLHDEIAKAKDYARREALEEVSGIVQAGKHVAVKLADLYRAAGQKPADCQAIRDWMTAVQPAPPEKHMQGLADAIAERVRQIDAEGWTTEHDDSHAHSEMARAAAAYCLGQPELTGRVQDGKRFLPWRSMIWPWSKEWWKPKTRREDLIRAAALIIAEIERLDRAATTEVSDANS